MGRLAAELFVAALAAVCGSCVQPEPGPASLRVVPPSYYSVRPVGAQLRKEPPAASQRRPATASPSPLVEADPLPKPAQPRTTEGNGGGQSQPQADPIMATIDRIQDELRAAQKRLERQPK